MSQGAVHRRESLVVAIIFVTWGLVFLDRMAVLYLAPYIAPDLHLTGAQIGSLAGIIALCWAVSALLFGALSDRVGRKAVLVPMVVLFSLLSACSGLARNFSQLFLVRALLGVAEGPCWTIMMALVEENSSAGHRGRNIGVVVSAAALIGLAAAPVMTTQVAAHLGWRPAFFIAGLPGLVMAALISWLVPEGDATPETHAHRLRVADVLSLLRFRNVWASAIGAAGFMTWLFVVNTFGPLYITQVERQSGTTAGFLMGAAGLGSFIIGLIGPSLSDRLGRRPVLAVLALLSTALPLALLTHALYGWLWVLAAILFVTHGGQAISAICIVLVPTESVRRSLAASSIGFTTMFGELIGGFLAPVAAGALVAGHGLGAPLWIAAGGTLLVFLITFALRAPAARVDARVSVVPDVP